MHLNASLFGRLSLRQLEVVAIVAPMLFLGGVYLVVLGPEHPVFHRWPGLAVVAIVLAAGVWFFMRAVFGAVRSLQDEVERLSEETRRHNERLVQLHGANLELMRETQIEAVIGHIPRLGARLSNACHAVLVVGEPAAATRAVIHPPLETGAVAGCALETGACDRDDPGVMGERERSLSMPLAHLGMSIGTLCLARGADAEPFSAIDEEVARMFATHAAMVMENARLYDQVRVLAIERERQALAREMHDGLAQVLSFVNTKAQAVELYLRDEDITAARQQMAELSEAAREVYADIRLGIGALRAEVTGKGLRELIAEYAQDFGESTGLDVQLDWLVDDGAFLPTPAADVQLLRIVQEALANAWRHAEATRICITATLDGDALVLTVEDDGRGFELGARATDGRPRFGLQTMTERASAVGGVLTVTSTPRRGTRVEVRVSQPAGVRPQETR